MIWRGGRVGWSSDRSLFCEYQNARLNLETEQPGFDFEKVKRDARKAWNDALSKVIPEGGSKDQQVIFYTSLYHALIHPNVLNDVNGEYPRNGR